MAEYINKAELWDNRPEWRNPKQIDKKEYNKGWNDCLNVFLDIMDAEPTIDIVHCKDCKYFCTDDGLYCSELLRETRADWFCADGEREEDGD